MATSTKKPATIPVDCTTCQARIDGLCQGYALNDLREIAGHKSGDRRVKAGQELLSLGEPCDAIYNLVDGWVILYILLEDGRRQILHFALPGAVLGFHPANGAMMTYGAQALTDAVVCVIPHKALGPLSRQYPEVGLRLGWLMSRDSSMSYAHLTSIGRHSARERVAHLILELFIRYRSRWPGHRIEEMHLPLTQEDIGDATGLTGIHVNRVLGDLKTEGILTFSYRRLSILDPDKLVDVAGTDPELLQSWIRQPAPAQSARDETVGGVSPISLTKGPRRRLGRANTGSGGAVVARCQA
ncbi:MAG: Crp/Fnr family transcriptional regulator [Aestuariivirga sp.]|nr:Crp/Fnr family transcriptional regulator [Aestuariivirga sp.]